MHRWIYENVECHRGIELWFLFIIGFCPLACLLTSYVAEYKARNNFRVQTFRMRALRRSFIVRSNDCFEINGTLLLVDIAHLAWSLTGLHLNSSLGKSPQGIGAISECMRDYGFVTVLCVKMMQIMGLQSAIRLIVYQLLLVRHRTTFGALDFVLSFAKKLVIGSEEKDEEDVEI